MSGVRTKSRSHPVSEALHTVGLLVALGVAGLQAQEVVDLPAEDQSLSGDLESVFRIGSAAAGAEWEEFSSIEGVGFDDAGNLYLLDTTEAGRRGRGVVVDAAGRYGTTFGRAGGGPGEFRAADGLVVWPDGRVLVEDVIRPAYHVFGPGGEFDRMVREPDRRILSIGRLRPERTSRWTLVGIDDGVILRVDMSGREATKHVAVEPWRPRGQEEVTRWVSGPDEIEKLIPDVWGFEPKVLFDALPSGGIAYSDSTAYAVRVTDSSGTVVRILRRSIRPMPVTEAVRRQERRRRLEEVRGRRVMGAGGEGPPSFISSIVNDVKAVQETRVEDMQFFSEVPVLGDLRVTWDGSLWVQRNTEPDATEPGAIDVITPDGRYIGTFARGSLTMPDAFGPDGMVAFIDTDEFDVPVITVMRIPVAIR